VTVQERPGFLRRKFWKVFALANLSSPRALHRRTEPACCLEKSARTEPVVLDKSSPLNDGKW